MKGIIRATPAFRAPALPTSRLAFRLFLYPVVALLGLIAIGAALGLIVLVLTYPNLPSLEVLTDYRPKIPSGSIPPTVT